MSVDSKRSDTETPKEIAAGLESPDVCTKYTTAGTIASKVLETVLAATVDGADIYELCKLGDDNIESETGKVYNKKGKDGAKTVEKGIGYPTCISVNELGGNFSPLKGESKTLRAGDVVKVELGVQIDGYIAEAGHTVVIPHGAGDSPSEKTSLDEAGRICDRRADVVKAAWTAAEAVLRTVQVGNKNTQVTDVLRDVSAAFKCQPVQGVLSHNLDKYVIDGPKVIASKILPQDDTHCEEFEFEVNQAYTMDIRMSTGDGKLRETDCRHTLYKRAPENSYMLKTAKARQFIGEVKKRFPSLPFSLRNFSDEQCARVGVSEANRHRLLHEYPVMTERVGEYVACFKFTVLLLPGGSKKISGVTFGQDSVLESPHQAHLPEEIKTLLSKSAAPRKKRNKKPAAEKEA